MGKSSFVLKQPGGKLAGYLMLSKGNVHVRVTCACSEGAQLVLTCRKQEVMRKTIERKGSEQVFLDEGKVIDGCYGVEGKTLLFTTDEAAREAFMLSVAAEQAKKKTENGREMKERPRLDVQKAAEEGQLAGEDVKIEKLKEPERPDQEKQYKRAERRWPPPACMPNASYSGGRWRGE